MSQIKECFPSRWEGGVILEADFSQLEVVGAALLSRDPVLTDDILSGVDMHRQKASELFKKPEAEVTDKERTTTKRLSFQLQYGAGAPSMSKKLDIKKAIAEDFIRIYYERYSRLAEWQAEIMEGVKRSRRPTEARLPSGLPQGRGEYESATGRLYVFLEKDKPEGWRGADLEPDFNPPEVKNYPVQGFATGDIMAVYRGRVLREWLKQDWRHEALPINTVHDSVMFDCRNKEVAAKMKTLLESVAARLPAILEELWGLASPLSFKIEVKAGPTWANTSKI